jgi:two-component system, OmpR family, sensor histidine kinase KdpD
MIETQRPDPDELLASLQKKQKKQRGGKLYLFLGMAPGVGKTYAMLLAAHEIKRSGIDVVVGVAETHGRQETKDLLVGLEIVPKVTLEYRDILLEEFDLDAVLKRKPKSVLVDELAHSNVPGSRHTKRWQDVFEILDAGIDVFSTLNIQHLESRKESVEKVVGIIVRETVPDSVLDRAHQIRLIDLSPSDLLQRLKEGKVYLGDKAEAALAHFFKEDKLTALREISLRLVAEKVDMELQGFAAEREAGAQFPVVDRLIVPISSHFSAEQLIRATRRLAFNLEASWIALYVDTGGFLSETETKMVTKNLELARSLGAETMAITDMNWAEAILRVAKQKNVTQIVVARPQRKWFKGLSENGLLLRQLLKSHVNVTIIGAEARLKEKSFSSIFSYFQIKSPSSTYIKAMGVMLLLSLLNAALAPFIAYRAVGFIFLIGTLVLGLFVPLGPILFSATFTAFIWDFFFIPPVGSFWIQDNEDVFMLVSYVIAALTISILSWRLQRQQEVLASREARFYMLYKTVRDIVTLANKEAMIHAVLDRLEEFLSGACDVSLARKDGSLKVFPNQRLKLVKIEREVAVAKWAMDNHKPAGWSTETLSAAEALYIPLMGVSEKIGVLAFQPKKKSSFPPQDADLLFAIARQLAISLEREIFRERALETGRLQETEKMHRAILNLITEELRTTLSTIVQSAEILGEKDPTATRLLDAAEKLQFAVDNLLTMSRLITGVFPLHKEVIAVTDLLDLAKGYIKRSLAGHQVKLNLIGEVSPVFVDAALCKQVFANILGNAAEYSPLGSSIGIEILQKGSEIQVVIRDQGSGIREEEMGRIFDKFYRTPGTKGVGVGLGLSVAKGILKVHGGKIAVENMKGGGAAFSLWIPITLP